MNRLEQLGSPEIADLPGNWIDLSLKLIERKTPNGAGSRTYAIPDGAARQAGMIGKFNTFDGVVIVGAPDGNFKVSKETPALISALRKAGYRPHTIAVPALLGVYENFVDPKMQNHFEQLV